MEFLKEQLYRLVGDREDYFSLKVCATLGDSKECKEDAERMRHFILAVPEMVYQIRAWGGKKGSLGPLPSLKKMVSAYLSKRRNIISHASYGLFGYIPDAVFVARVYQTLMNRIDPSRRWAKLDTEAIAKQIPRWLSLAKEIIPSEVEKVEKLLTRLIERDDKTSLGDLRQRESMVNEGGPA
jgi:hypothetical protein